MEITIRLRLIIRFFAVDSFRVRDASNYNDFPTHAFSLFLSLFISFQYSTQSTESINASPVAGIEQKG